MRKKSNKKCFLGKSKFWLYLPLLVLLLGAPRVAYATDPLQVALASGVDGGQMIINIWNILLNFANVTALVGFLFIAFANIIRFQINTYAIKKILPSLIIAIIAANLSFLICRVLIDLSVAVADPFLDGAEILTTNFRELSGIDKTIQGTPTQIDSENMGALLIGSLIKLIGSLFVLVLGALFVLRIYILYFLIAISPIAFISIGLPFSKSIWSKWWKSYTQWIFTLPVASFWLWLGAQFWKVTTEYNLLGADSTDFGGLQIAGYLFGVVCMYLAMTTPFKMAGEFSSLAGKVQNMAMTATGVYAGQRLAQNAYQYNKNVAGETAKGLALQYTPYGTIARGMKQTAEARKTRIDLGMTGSVARNPWGQKLLNVVTFGGKIGAPGAKKYQEMAKLDKQKLEVLAEAENLNDEKLQRTIREKRLRAEREGSKNLLQKSHLEQKYLLGDENEIIKAFKKRFKDDWQKIWDDYQETIKEGGDLEEFLKKKLAEEAIEKPKLTDEIKKQIREENKDQWEQEATNELRKSGSSKLIDQETDLIQATSQDETIKNNREKATELAVKALKDKFIEQQYQKALKEKETIATSQRKTAVEDRAKTEEDSPKVGELQNLLQSVATWQSSEGARAREANQIRLETALEPIILKKFTDDADLDQTTVEMARVDALNKLKKTYTDKGIELNLTDQNIKNLLAKLDTNQSKALEIYRAFLKSVEENSEYYRIRENRLKYIHYGNVQKKGIEDAKTESIENAVAALAKMKDQLPDLIGGNLQNVTTKNQQNFHRKGAEIGENLKQSTMNPEFIDAIHSISGIIKNIFDNGTMDVRVVDGHGNPQSAQFNQIIGHELSQKFGVIKGGELVGMNTGTTPRAQQLSNEMLQVIKADRNQAEERGGPIIYNNLMKWLVGKLNSLNVGSSTPEKTMLRDLLRQSGILTALYSLRDNPIDNIDKVVKMVLNASEGKLKDSNGALPGQGLDRDSDEATWAALEEAEGHPSTSEEEGEET